MDEARQLFSGFSIKELQDYIRECGGNPSAYFERSELINEAARLSLAAAQQQGAGAAAGGGGYPDLSRGFPSNGPYGAPGGHPSPWGAPPAAGAGGPFGAPPAGGGGSAPPNPFGAPPPNPFGAPPQAAGAPSPYGMPPTSAAGPGAGPYGAPPPGAAPPSPYGAPAAAPGASPYGAPPPVASAPTPHYGMPAAAAAAQRQGQYAAPAPGPYAAPGAAAGAQAYGAPPPGQAAYGGAPQAGLKKALIIGCNYPGTQSQLRGCINDAQCMEYMLKSKFGFRPENMKVLRDDTQNPAVRPTRANIMNHIQWLVTNNPPGTSLVFHFSGHGSQQRDYSGEESDGMNETILPTDFRQAGQIVDNDLNRALCNPLPPGVRLHAVIDACHSGTALDLPYRIVHNYGQIQWKQEYDPRRVRSWKGTAGGRAIQISAASDHQVAADTNRMSGGTHTGAATFSFIQAVEKCGGNISYGQLMTEMHRVLDKGAGAMPAPPTGGLAGGLLGLLLGGSVGAAGLQRGQTPVLSCNEAFDLNERMVL